MINDELARADADMTAEQLKQLLARFYGKEQDEFELIILRRINQVRT